MHGADTWNHIIQSIQSVLYFQMGTPWINTPLQNQDLRNIQRGA